MRGLARLTIVAYRLDLRRLTDCLGADRAAETIGRAELHTFAEHCGARWSCSTHRRALVVAALLLRFARAEGLIPVVPPLPYLPRVPRRLPPVPSASEVAAVLALPDTSTPEGLRAVYRRCHPRA